MAKKTHRIGKSKKKRSRKMPDNVRAHFAAITLRDIKRRGITPRLMTTKKRRRK